MIFSAFAPSTIEHLRGLVMQVVSYLLTLALLEGSQREEPPQ